MDKKQFNARIKHKIDTYANWEKATNFIPLKGELIIYTTDENGNEKIGFKVGTGEPDKNVHQLDFISLSETAAITEVDWEDIKNKPFYEIGFNYEWDGKPTSSYINIPDFYTTCYKVAEAMSKEDILGSEFIGFNGAYYKKYTITEDLIIPVGDKSFFVVTDTGEALFSSIFEIGQLDLSIAFPGGPIVDVPKSGLWFLKGENGSRSVSLTSSNYELKQIDSKYVAPSWKNIIDKPFYNNKKLEWDGNKFNSLDEPFFPEGDPNDYMCKISNRTDVTKDKLIGKKVAFSTIQNDEIMEFTIEESMIYTDIAPDVTIVINSDGYFVLASLSKTVSIDGITVSEGVWFFRSDNEGFYTKYLDIGDIK